MGTGILAKIVQSTWFDAVCASVVLLNALYAVWSANVTLKHRMATSTMFMEVSEICFCVIYYIELGLKIAVHGRYFLVNRDLGWNCIDVVIIALSTTTIIIFYVNQHEKGLNLNFLRSVRIMKVVRILRMLRIIKVFRELRSML